jgi:hypothetical protein
MSWSVERVCETHSQKLRERWKGWRTRGERDPCFKIREFPKLAWEGGRKFLKGKCEVRKECGRV